jgi:hypothetical protein
MATAGVTLGLYPPYLEAPLQGFRVGVEGRNAHRHRHQTRHWVGLECVWGVGVGKAICWRAERL